MTNKTSRLSYDPSSLQKVQEALAWAYRSGYVFAEDAAKELADAMGWEVTKRDLGSYGDTIEFRDRSC